MEINVSPVKTARNYGINSININLPIEKTAILEKNIENLAQNSSNLQKNEELNNNINYFKKFENFYASEVLNDNKIEIEDYAENKNENYLSKELLLESKSYANFQKSIIINESLNETYRLVFNFDKNNYNLIGTFNLFVKKDVKANIVIEFNGNINLENYQNFNIKINIEENAKANIIVYTDLGLQSTNLFSIQSDIQKNAKLDITFLDISCKNSIFNYKSKILGEHGESNLNTLYLGDNDSIIDLNYLIEIYAPKCKTNMEILGTIADNARKHFKGTIDFKKGCPKSIGSENEFCMLLSKNTKSKALPMILCTEEDVDGKHSSSVGKVDEKELFYIMSRGLTQSEATRLIIKAKFNKILKNLFDEDLSLKILNMIDRKIK